MKKILVILILMALVWLGINISERKSADRIVIAPDTSKPDASNATFIFEDGPVKLNNGLAETSGGMIPTETILTDTLAYGDVNGDNKNDTVAVLVQNSSGSGVFVYLAAYVSGNVTYKGSNALFIGDRISPKKIEIESDGSILFSFLDRSLDEPMSAEPTISTSKTFIFREGTLEEK